MSLKKSDEQKRREKMLAIVRDPRNWMIASEQEELDKELAEKKLADKDAATDAWLKCRFKQTREEFLASRRVIKQTTTHPVSAKSQESPPNIIKKIIPPTTEDTPAKNFKVSEKARELKLLKSYDFTAKSGEKITITKLSQELCGNEGDLHRNSNCKLAGECLSFVLLKNIHYFSCVKCEQYSLNYQLLRK